MKTKDNVPNSADLMRKHFLNVKEYSEKKGVFHEEDPYIVSRIQKEAVPGDRVLEIVGGSGALLDLILDEAPAVRAYNLEIAFEAYKHQCDGTICLIGGNALRLPFQDNAFEFVIMKNVLHPLVGTTRKVSKRNTITCLDEIRRVTKPDGLIVILEQYNRSSIASTCIFYVTTILSRLGVEISALRLNKYVIVSFLTPDEIREVFSGSDQKIEIEEEHQTRYDVNALYTCSLLMANIGRVVLMGRNKKSSPFTPSRQDTP
jgi:ubiquinone/menaquinone biosynthesis C-methylase UbiE